MVVVYHAFLDASQIYSCHFHARANPSAGVVNYLQSTLCNLDNRCYSLRGYEEIPTYGNAT